MAETENKISGQFYQAEVRGVDGSIETEGVFGKETPFFDETSNLDILNYISANLNYLKSLLSNVEGQLNQIRDTGTVDAIINWNAVSSEELPDGLITESKISNGAITQSKLADNIVGANHIIDNSISTKKIKDEAITGAKLRNKSVTKEKLDLNELDASLLKLGSITSELIANGAVGTLQVENNSITELKLQDDSVGTSKIKNNSITSDKIQEGAITHDKIKDGSFTGDKLESNSIGSIHLRDSSVGTEHLINLSVSSDKVQDNAIETRKLKNFAVTEDKIATKAVTESKIAESSINNSHIQDGSITSNKIQDGSITAAKVSSSVLSNIAEIAAVKMSTVEGRLDIRRDTSYVVGDIAESVHLPSWSRLECVIAGTTSSVNPEYSNNITPGQLVRDGSSLWVLDDVRDGHFTGEFVLSLVKPSELYIDLSIENVITTDNYPRLYNHLIKHKDFYSTLLVANYKDSDGDSTATYFAKYKQSESSIILNAVTESVMSVSGNTDCLYSTSKTQDGESAIGIFGKYNGTLALNGTMNLSLDESYNMIMNIDAAKSFGMKYTNSTDGVSYIGASSEDPNFALSGESLYGSIRLNRDFTENKVTLNSNFALDPLKESVVRPLLLQHLYMKV